MKRFLALLLAICMVFNFNVPSLSVEAADTHEILLHYDFNEMNGTTVKDKQGNYDGTIVGNVNWVDGVIDGAVSLSGDRENYVDIPSAVFKQSDDISIVAWVKANAVETWTSLMTVGSGTSNYAVMALKGNPANNPCGLTMATKVNGSDEYRVRTDAGVSPNAGEWTMITFTQSGTNAKIYLNDTLVAETNDMQKTLKQVVEANGNSTARLGSSIMFADPALNGAVDDLKIYGTILSADEVKALTLVDNPENDNNIIAHYEMKESSGTSVTDSKNNYDGTLAGNAAWTDGINGKGVELFGTGDYITVPRDAFLQSEDISVSMWVKPNVVANWSALMVVGGNRSSGNYAIMAIKGTPSNNSVGLTMAIKCNNGSEYRISAPSGTTLSENKWSLVTYTQTGSNACIYLDGVLVAESNGMNSSIRDVLEADANSDVRIGNNRVFTSDPNLVGVVSEVKVRSRISSEAEEGMDYMSKKSKIAALEVKEAADSVDLGSLADVYEDIELPVVTDNGVHITWKSSNSQFITNEGIVTSPSSEQGVQNVTLTATFKSDNGSATVTKTYTATLYPLTDARVLEQKADYVRRYVDYIINDGYELLTENELGCDIRWELADADGRAEIKDGKVVKTLISKERQPVKLKAILSKGNATKEVIVENVVLMDKYEGYILSFFGGNDNQQKLHLGYSYDGINWSSLNDGNSVLPTTLGNGNVRDPFIMRKKDGSFGILATQGWDTSQIYLWDSQDLVKFENERLKTVTTSSVAGLTGRRAWAPEASYDPVNDEYIIYWSDPYANGNNGCIYGNTSADLVEFSEPFVMFDAGYQIIDANIIKHKGTYYMVFKDERGNNSDGGGGKHILMAQSDSLEPGSFVQYTGAITGAPVEGPFMFKVNGEEKWYHYYDYFNEHKFGVSSCTDLAGGEWTFLGKSETMPTDNVQHGGVVAVTKKELNRILAGYGITGAVQAPNLVTLQETVNNAKNTNLDGYTEESVNNLLEAIDSAEKLLALTDLTSDDQSRVDSMNALVKNAVESLTKEGPSVAAPIEVIGFEVQSVVNSDVTFVWGQSNEQLNLQQSYNVYIDGHLYNTYPYAQSVKYTFTSAGTHEIKVTAVLNGQETAGVGTTVEIKDVPNILVREGIEINGYQVSATAKGMRTIYSAERTIDNKEVVSVGMVYSLADYASKEEMYVGSPSYYVRSYEATSAGVCPDNHSDSESATSYAMTMRFGANTASEYNANWRIRAYAKLSDGSYIYSDIYEYRIYDIAEELYQGSKMNTETAHEYLYNDILKVVNKDYVAVEYAWPNGKVVY